MGRLVAIGILLAVTSASAQNKSEAARLFEEGRALLEQGKPLEACQKFEQSIAKDPRQTGALMNLALCNERTGKIATALRLYQEAFDRANEANLARTRELASDAISRLSSKVPVVRFRRAGTPAPSEKLLVDDVVVQLHDDELRVDPGRHIVVLTAPERLAFQTSLELDAGERKEVVLPVLALPVIVAPSSRRFAGKITVAAGAALLLTSAGIAFYAKRDYDSLFEGSPIHCGVYPPIDGRPACDDEGQARSENDHRLATAATVIGAVGVAAAIAGVVIWLTAPSETPKVTPAVSASGAGVIVHGTF